MNKHNRAFWIMMVLSGACGYSGNTVEASVFYSTGVLLWVFKPEKCE